MLAQLGDEAKLLAGGQSLIPLLKLRFANPAHLVDLNFIPGTSYVTEEAGALRLGAMTRHAEVEHSPVAWKIPILHDVAAGIADVQVRNRGTVGGSVAEADPSGDWATVLSTLDASVVCATASGTRTVNFEGFIQDAYTTALAHDELVQEIAVKIPAAGSGGAFLAFKRSAPVYASASVAVQLTLQGDVCSAARVALGCVGLGAIRASEAEGLLTGHAVTADVIAKAAEAARAAAEPQPDMRGSVEYKRALIAALTKKAIGVALRRAAGENVEASHLYA